MSGLILPDESVFPETDISIPSFIQVNPDGTVGLNYLGLVGNALSQPQPRYHGLYSYRNIVAGQPIIPPAQLNNGDLMTLVAATQGIAPFYPSLMWHFIGYFASGLNPPPYTWFFIGGGSYHFPVNDTNVAINSGAPWVFLGIQGLGLQTFYDTNVTITIPVSGTYEIEGGYELQNVSAATETEGCLPSWPANALGNNWFTRAVPPGGFFDSVAFPPEQQNLSKGDILKLAVCSSAAVDCIARWNFGCIRPISIPNNQ